MYCVRCGVKLKDGEKGCPLCQTPVLLDDSASSDTMPLKYSDKYPDERTHGKFLVLGMATAVMLAACIACFVICIKTYQRVYWSGYVMLGIALAWIVLILPFWFKKRNPLIFAPVDFAAVCGYLLYICAYNKQHWFLRFAFPVTMLLGILCVTAIALFLYVKRGRLFITGGLMTAIGASCMLIEFFQHITFGTKMFIWSLHCVSFFSSIGLFLIIAAIIPPLASCLERKFFF